MDVILTTYQGAFLGPIARLLGKILEAIYYVLSLVGIENVGICIILFTFIVNTLMFPLQIKQQKFSKMSSIMNPELQAIQKKYKNKKDQASQQKMSMETQAVYQKYGVSPASGCLPLLITFPILFALYRVIYNVPAYVDQVYDIYVGIAGNLKNMEVTVEQLAELVQTQTYVVSDAVKNAKEVALSKVDLNYYIDVLGQFNKVAWDELGKKYPALSVEIQKVSENASHINSFLGMNIADAPKLKSMSISVPILSVITQIISTKLSMAGMPQQDNADNPAASSMKMMNNVMPFVSGLMCFMFPIGVGLYWVAGNVFRIFQSLGINLYFSRIDMNEEMQKNMEKSKKRMEKMGVNSNSKMQDFNNQKRKIIENKKEEKTVNAAQVTKNMKKSNYQRQNNTKYEKGSIAAYANMLNRDIPSNEEK